MENKILECLKSRRSIRSYEERQVEEDVLQKVLEAGTWAPTGMGRQSPVIVVVQDKDTRDRLSRINAAVMHSDNDPFYGAPTVLVVLADTKFMTWREDGSLVLGNMMNAAHALGLGSCWIHRAFEVFDTQEGKALLKKWGLDESFAGVGNCILGYAKGEPRAAKPRKDGYILRV